MVHKYFKVGDFVYQPYSPQKAGKVIKTEIKSKRFPNGNSEDYLYVTVKFLDGTVKELWELHLNDFNQLIADHEKKLQTHRSKLVKLQQL